MRSCAEFPEDCQGHNTCNSIKELTMTDIHAFFDTKNSIKCS